jgi:hypothetical protein
MRRDEEIDPMGWQLGHSVVRGEIDARERDRVSGRIWLIDRQLPLELTLKGNPLRDLAGCLLTFENPNPKPEENEGLSPIQMGKTGEITASRKTRIYDLSPQQVHELQLRGEPVDCRIGSLLTIEWYSNANGRVTIEATDFTISISEFSWRMTKDEEQEQLRRNRQVFERWSAVIASESDDDDNASDDDTVIDEDSSWHMDEFQWEKQLQESDAMTHRYMELIELYLDHPEREQIIAHEMGWDGLERFLEDDSWSEPDFDDEDDYAPLEPLAHTEGRDWIRSRDGSIRHPLCERAMNLAMRMWDQCKELGLTNRDGEGDADIQSMLFNMQTISAKLAGALNGLPYDDDPDGGFIVACLKRSLHYFGQTITSMSVVSQKSLLPPPLLQGYREELFAIRQEVLALMTQYRQLD